MSMKSHKTSGFTIIELLIASAVFSIVLVIVMATFIQISRIFYKGVNMANTQDDTRNVITDIASDIQFMSGTTPKPVNAGPSSSGTFCIGSHLYAYYTGVQVGQSSSAGLYREDGTAGSCPASIDLTKADQLLGSGMQMNTLNLSCNGTICHINTHVVFYGSSYDGLFATKNSAYANTPWLAPDADCTGALTSSQFCATADFQRTVLQRI